MAGLMDCLSSGRASLMAGLMDCSPSGRASLMAGLMECLPSGRTSLMAGLMECLPSGRASLTAGLMECLPSGRATLANGMLTLRKGQSDGMLILRKGQFDGRADGLLTLRKGQPDGRADGGGNDVILRGSPHHLCDFGLSRTGSILSIRLAAVYINQCWGSDPYLDPDSQSGSGSLSRRAKMTHKNREKLINFIF
jgi:hypothetical protein